MNLEIFSCGAVYIPWPTRINDVLIPSQLLPMHPYCMKKCKSRECENFIGDNCDGVCHYGFTYYHALRRETRIVVFGIIGQDRSNLPKYSRDKSSLKGRFVGREQYYGWLTQFAEFLDIMCNIETKSLSNALQPLHDTSRLSREVLKLSEKVVDAGKGSTFTEKYAKAPPEIKCLFKTAELLVDTFDLAAIYFNPASAKFGKPRPMEIYKLLDKLHHILNTSEGELQGRSIQLIGCGHNVYFLYETFKLLPFSLLQNAQKYSQSGPVRLEFSEDEKGAKISVVSIGPIIEKGEIPFIFERGRRGKWAENMTSEGLGVGLYVAKIVAEANQTAILVNSEALNYSTNGIPQARNTFSFDVKSLKR